MHLENTKNLTATTYKYVTNSKALVIISSCYVMSIEINCRKVPSGICLKYVTNVIHESLYSVQNIILGSYKLWKLEWDL
jgi:hypothetical protein